MRPSIQTILRGALLGVATAVALGLRSDPDLWGHIRFGSDFLDTLTVPTRDSYSFTAGDHPWINHEWLFEVFVALIFRAAGPVGFSIAVAATAVASIFVTRRAGRDAGLSGWRLDVLTGAVFLLGIAPLQQTFRANAVSALMVLVLLACIRGFDAGKHHGIWVLPPLFLLWANVHGGWVLGGAILATWAATRFAAAPRDPWRRRLMLVCAATAAVTFINPDGPHLWVLLLQTVRLERSDVREWHSVITSAPMLVAWCITTAVLAAGAWRAPRGARVYVALGLFTAVASFRVMRLLPYHAMTVFVLVGPWILSWSRAEAKDDGEVAFVPRDWAVTAAVWATVVAGSVTTGKGLGCLRPGGAFSLDGRAGDFLRQNRVEGRMLVYFDWGEYVVWHLGPGLKVSIDGRRETAYSAQTIAQHQTFYKAEPGARAYLEELQPDLVWLPRKVAVSKVLDGWGWHPVFESPESVVWARDPSARPWQPAQQEQPSRCFPGP